MSRLRPPPAAAAAAPRPADDRIGIEDFQKVRLRTAKILVGRARARSRTS